MSWISKKKGMARDKYWPMHRMNIKTLKQVFKLIKGLQFVVCLHSLQENIVL